MGTTSKEKLRFDNQLDADLGSLINCIHTIEEGAHLPSSKLKLRMNSLTRISIYSHMALAIQFKLSEGDSERVMMSAVLMERHTRMKATNQFCGYLIEIDEGLSEIQVVAKDTDEIVGRLQGVDPNRWDVKINHSPSLESLRKKWQGIPLPSESQ